MDDLLPSGSGFVAAWALALVAFGVVVYLSPMGVRRLAEAHLVEACRARRALVLTYDDGPGECLTVRLLELLRERGARATFYSLGRRAVAAPAVLDRVAAAGHEIGTHSFGHVNAIRSAPWTAFADVRRGFTTHARWLAESPAFRPPHGKVTVVTWALTRLRRARVGWWTIDAGDTWDELPEPCAVVHRVRDARGGVVLLHDFDRVGDESAARTEFVLDVTRRLLDLAAAEGMQVLTMEQLLGDTGAARGGA